MRKEVYVCDGCGHTIDGKVFPVCVREPPRTENDEEYERHFCGLGCALVFVGTFSTVDGLVIRLAEKEV